jgi:hypothetical protein
MLSAPGEPPLDIFRRNVVSTFDYSLAHAPNRFTHIRNPHEVQLDFLAAPLHLLEDFYVALSA